MSTLVAVALGIPLLGAVLTVLVDRTSGRRAGGLAGGPAGRLAGAASAASAGLAWAAIAAADTVPVVGRIEARPSAAAAIAGLAVLVASRLPRSPLAASSSLCGITVFAVASTTGTGTGPDRPLAVGVAALVLLSAVRLRAGAAPRWVVVSVTAAGAPIVAGLLLADADVGPVLVVVGTSLCLAVSALSGPGLSGSAVSGAVLPLVPVVLYATARAVEAADAADVVAVSGTAIAVVVAVGLHMAARTRRRRGSDVADGRVVAAAAALAAVVLMTQDLADLRTAGALLAAGAVLATVTDRPAGLVACAPGSVAAVEALGVATDAVHAAAGAAVVAIVAGVVLLAPAATAGPAKDGAAKDGAAKDGAAKDGAEDVWLTWSGSDWPVAVPATFAVVPLWGWAGPEPPGYATAVTTAGAAAAVTALALLLAGLVPPVRGRTLGRLRSRRRVAVHASTNPRAEVVDPGEDPHAVAPEVEVPRAERGAPEGPPDQEGRGAEGSEPEAQGPEGPAQHPVAESSGPVPGRAVRGGVDRRIRVRGRAGRPPR